MKFSTILTLALYFLTETHNEPLKCWECNENFELGKDQMPKCDEMVSRTCPNNGNYHCVTVSGTDKKGGSPVQFKKCVKSDTNFCHNLNMTYNLTTCRICSSDFCNKGSNYRECWFSDPSKEFYDQSDDKVACFDENYNCLNAQKLQNKTLSLIRGCIRPAETQKTCNDYKKKNFTCSVCGKNYCNRDEFVKEISCYKCKGDCNQVEKKLCPGHSDFKCISVDIKGEDGGNYEKIKGCVVKTNDFDPCKKFVQNGSSCRVCNTNFCNTDRSDVTDNSTLRCLQCYGDDCIYKKKKHIEVQECGLSDYFSCLTVYIESPKGSLKQLRSCIRRDLVERTCRNYEKIGSHCGHCSTDKCKPFTFCYQCKNATECKDPKRNICPIEASCFVIKTKKSETIVMGCVLRNETVALHNKYKGQNFEFSICQNDLCGYKDNGIDIDPSFPEFDYSNKNNKTGALKCYKCHTTSTFCEAIKVDCNKNSSCLLAEGFENGKINKRKECVLNNQSKSICNDYKNKGFDCVTCNENFCNRNRTGPARKCFTCDDKFCKTQRQEICPDYDDFSCLSVKYPESYLKREGSVILTKKYCVVKYGAKIECDSYREKFNASECNICDHIDLCNGEPETGVKSNVKRYSASNYRLVMSVYFLILLK